MAGDIKSSVDRSVQCWSDPKFVIALIAPFGALVWLGASIVLAVTPYFIYFTAKGAGASEAKKAVITAMVMVFFLAGLYYCVSAFLLFFIELRKKFIVRKLVFHDGEFTLRGYYFKQASFKETELAKVEPLVLSERWFSKDMGGTFLSRSTPPNVRSGQNINWKVTLHDGRVFYLPGEIGRSGVWAPGDGEKLKDFLEERMSSTATSTPAPEQTPSRRATPTATAAGG